MNNKNIQARCKICNGSFDVTVLLQSSANKFYCKECFKKSICSANAVEAGDTRTETLAKSCAKLIPRPEIYVQSAQVAHLIHHHQNISLMSLSKRPLQCPKAECNKYISVCTLESHFKHEHKDTPIMSTHLDVRCTSDIYPRDIRYCIIQCIVLLKVTRDELQQHFQKSQMSVALADEQRPVMVLMSTRIPNLQLKEEEEGMPSPRKDADESDDSEVVFRKNDRIIVWLASNIQVNLSYTVAVSTMDSQVRQKYFGPMLTLNESPEMLCRDGKCLILTYFHCNGMTDKGDKPLLVDVVIHGPQ